MATTTDFIPTLKQELDQANPSNAWDLLRYLKLGGLIGQLAQQLTKKVPAASAYASAATTQTIALPDGSKAIAIKSAYARVGTVTGPLTPVAAGVTPATGQIGIDFDGNLIVLTADAITSVDVAYEPMPAYDVLEQVFPVDATGAIVLPASVTDTGALFLLEAEVTKGTIVGKKGIVAPGAAPATLKANLDVPKGKVQFNLGTDAPTEARVKLAYGQVILAGGTQSIPPTKVDRATALGAVAPF